MSAVAPGGDRAELREIHGPAALGGPWRRFWSLTWLVAVTEFRLSYFGSVLGYFWSLVRPLMLFGVLYVVFTQVVNFGGGIQDYPVVLLLNVVLFSFFTEATTASVVSVLNREALVRKMQFPRMVIPVSIVLTATFNLLLNLVAVLAFIVVYGVTPLWTWLLFPFLLVPLVAVASGVAMLLSALYVRYRDVQPIWGVAATLLFYGTPVLYVYSSVPESAQRLILCNPLAVILEQARQWVIDPSAPGAVEAIGGWGWLMIPVAIGIAICWLGFRVFDREAPRIAERL